jgi:hypothetical protein
MMGGGGGGGDHLFSVHFLKAPTDALLHREAITVLLKERK